MATDRFGGTILDDAPVENDPSKDQSALSGHVDRFGGYVVDDTAGSQLHSLIGQLQQQYGQPAGGQDIGSTLANQEIIDRQYGRGLVAQPTAADGSTTYTMGRVAPNQQVSTPEKLAITDAYRQQYNQFQPAPGDRGAMQAQDVAQLLQQRIDTASPLENFSGAGSQALANAGANLVGVVAPQTANTLTENAANTYQYNPDTKAATVGNFVGNTLPLLPAMVAGPGAAAIQNTTAGVLGAGAFGQVRSDVARRRSNGEQISTGQELSAAALTAASTLFANKLALGVPGKGLEAVRGIQNDVLRTVSSYAANAGIVATDMEIMQVTNNAIQKAFIDSNHSLTEGVGEAGLTGAAVGALGAGLTGTPKAEGTPAPVRPGAPAEASGVPAAKPAIPVPTPEVMESLKLGTAPEAAPQAESKYPILDKAAPRHRITEGGVSRGVGLEFASPEDKALYLASVPRKGKVSVEAESYLKDQGYKPEAIGNYADELRARIDEQAKGFTGDTLKIGPAEPAAESAPVEAPPAEAKAPEAKPEAKPSTPEIAAPARDPQAVADEYNPGAKVVREVPKGHAEVLAVAEELTGKQAHAYTGGRGRGFSVEGETFYNAEKNKTPQQRKEAIAHEATHWLQDNKPEVVAAIDKAIPEKTKAKLLAEYQQDYAHQEGKGLSTDQHTREVQAMAVGRVFSRVGVMRQVMADNPSAFAKGADAVITKLRSLTAAGRLTNEVVAQLRRVRAEINAKDVAEKAQKLARRPRESDVEAVNYLPEHSPKVRDEAEEYARSKGLPTEFDNRYAEVNPERAKRIADEYSALKHDPAEPKVKASYDAFKQETLDQYEFLKGKGVKFEAWTKEGQPYRDSAEMMKDARDNKHLWFFQGGDLPTDHPLAEKVPGTPDYTYNDVFRAVHDYFGHAKEGVGFGPRGEENAWRSHSQMYSEEARGAMTAETRGQNSWVNFGPHGEHNRTNPTQTIYAQQKAGLLTPEYSKIEPSYLPEYKPRNEKRKNTLEELQEHLTPQEYETISTPQVKRAIDIFQSLPPDAEFAAGAKAGVAKKGWYEKASASLVELFGPDARRFATVLAADSPRQSVMKNFQEALRVWRVWDEAGRPTDPAKVRELLEGSESVNQGEGLFGDITKDQKIVDLGGRIPNLIRALTGPEAADLSGHKVNSFAANLRGDLSKSTNDTWMAKFGDVGQELFADNGGYLGYTAKVRRVAKSLGIEPAHVQETVWSFFKTLTEAVNSKTSGQQALKNLTHEDILSTPAFHDMLNDPYVHEQLTRLGYSEDALSRAELAAKAAGGGEQNLSGPVTRRGSDVLASIADRAEKYAGRSAEDGGEQLSYLPGGRAAKSFIDEDVRPALADAAEKIGKAFEGAKNLLGLQNTSGAKYAKGVLRERGAELDQRFARMNEALNATREAMEPMPTAAKRQFIADMEAGKPQSDPALQPAADALKALLKDRLHQVQARGGLFTFVQDYFPHLWKDPTKAASLYAESKRPFEGKKSFLKQRSLPTLADGIAKGLEPVTENPVEAAMLRVREMDKFITAHDALSDLGGRGLLHEIKATDKLPTGYSNIDDKFATIYAKPNRRGGLSIAGRIVAPDAVASVINNYLSPGLRGHKAFGGIFRAYLGAGNVMNQAQLAISAFHLLNTSIDSATSKIALGLRQIGQGQVKEAGKSFLSAGTLVGPAISNISEGGKIIQEWRKPGSTTPEIAAVVDAMKAAGGRTKMDDFYHAGMTDKMMEAFKKGNVIGGALRLPFAGLEQLAKPVMEKLVPRMKLGVFMDMARFELQKLGPGASRAEVREAMGKAWDSVDNRMGELVYDNLFWNKAVKDLAMASTRSVGWNLGTFRELGGGLLDTASALNRVRMDKHLGNVEFTHRMAYTVAMPIMAGLMGGVVHYLLNHEAPKELKDWFFPKTGEKDKEGHDVRLALPSYMKDVVAYAKNPGRTLGNKVHPLLNTVLEMLTNHDYYGTKIRNEDDPFVKQLLDLAKHGATTFEPFGVREVRKLAEQGQGARSILPLLGVVQARQDITNTAAELKAKELLEAKMPRGTRTQEQADKAKLVRTLADSLHNHEPTAREDIRKAYAEGSITPSDVQSIRDRQKTTGLLERSVRALDMHDAMKVWDAASDAEKAKVGPQMFAKLRAAKALTRDERVAFMKTLQDDWKRLRGNEAVAASEE